MTLSTMAAFVFVASAPQEEKQPPAAGASKATFMGAIAAGMKPGTWAELKTEGFGKKLLDCTDGVHSILEWTGKGTWDPRSKKFLFIGAGHYASQKFIVYSAETNRWTEEPLPWKPHPEHGHAYERNALDPVKGELFYVYTDGRGFHRYNIAQKSWKEFSRLPDDFSVAVAMAQEYFPGKGLVYVTAGNVYLLDEKTGRWSRLASGLPCPDHCFVSYNPVQKLVWLGGGGGKTIYRLDASGKVSALKHAPIPLGIYRSVVTPDPVSGKYLVFGGDAAAPGKEETFYEFDVTTDSWTLQNVRPLLFKVSANPVFYTAAAPVAGYGVNMFITYAPEPKVLLYKHSDKSPAKKD